jgi:hypothetical protein
MQEYFCCTRDFSKIQKSDDKLSLLLGIFCFILVDYLAHSSIFYKEIFVYITV